MKTVLYLDQSNKHIEQLLLDYKHPDLVFKFLHPFYGEQGYVEEADYILTANYQVTKDVIDKAPNLKLIAKTGVGFDNIDIAYARKKGIDVTIARGSNATSVAELVILFMLDCCRKVHLLNASTKKGEWESWEYRHNSFELSGKTIGVLGAGSIGQEVIKKLASFDVNIIYYNIRRLTESEESKLNITYHPIEAFLRLSDIVTIHLPLVENTKELIGKKELSLMKKSAFLINTARGPIIDEDALIWALKNHEIAGAALDVFNQNPPDDNSPLLTYSNVITTPHIAGATIDAYKKIFSMCIKNIIRLEQGKKPKFIVNP